MIVLVLSGRCPRAERSREWWLMEISPAQDVIRVRERLWDIVTENMKRVGLAPVRATSKDSPFLTWATPGSPLTSMDSHSAMRPYYSRLTRPIPGT